jgi:hypothetical protein
MSDKYCLGCGKRNPSDANLCCKCGKNFAGAAAIPSRVAVASVEEEQILPTPVRSRPRPAPLPPKSRIPTDEEEEDDEKDDGLSLDYVPDLSGFEVEAIEKEEVIRVPLDGILATAKAKGQKGKGRKKK